MWPRLLPLLFIVHLAWADPLAENQARFGKIEGTVFLLSQGAKDWIDAHEDLPIEPGDEIHAEEDSRAEIALAQNALVVLQPESDLIADTLGDNGGRVHVTEGNILARTDIPASTGHTWEFETPGAVANADISELAVRVHEGEPPRIVLYTGTMIVQPAEGAAGLPPSIKLTTRKELVLRRGSPVQQLTKLSEGMQALSESLADLRTRHKRIENTWSPFTTTYRLELRRKFVAKVVPHTTPPRVRPRRRRKGAASDAAF